MSDSPPENIRVGKTKVRFTILASLLRSLQLILYGMKSLWRGESLQSRIKSNGLPQFRVLFVEAL
mgnify:CR=1 FL=1